MGLPQRSGGHWFCLNLGKTAVKIPQLCLNDGHDAPRLFGRYLVLQPLQLFGNFWWQHVYAGAEKLAQLDHHAAHVQRQLAEGVCPTTKAARAALADGQTEQRHPSTQNVPNDEVQNDAGKKDEDAAETAVLTKIVLGFRVGFWLWRGLGVMGTAVRQMNAIQLWLHIHLLILNWNAILRCGHTMISHKSKK